MKKTLIIISAITLVTCTAKKVATVASSPQSAVEIGAQKYSGYTQADFDSGKSLYEGNCGNCHGLKNPASRDEQEWRKDVANMAPKANRKAGKDVIGMGEQELIVRYLVAAGSAQKMGK